jgi:hypothetical protein
MLRFDRDVEVVLGASAVDAGKAAGAVIAGLAGFAARAAAGRGYRRFPIFGTRRDSRNYENKQ